jgi:type III secretory pathway component EscV
MLPTTVISAGARAYFAQALVLPCIIIGAVFVLIAPIPPFLLDILLSINLTVAVIVLLTTLAVNHNPDSPCFECSHDAPGANPRCY